MKIKQGLGGVDIEMTTYRPSLVGQVLATVIFLIGLLMFLLALPSGTILCTILAALVFLFSGTLTGPTLRIQITSLVLQETIEGRIRSWPLEELRDIEEERWSLAKRRMGQIRFSTTEGSEVIGGGNRWEEIRWMGTVLRLLVRARRDQIAAMEPDARMEARPPTAILEIIKR